MCYDANSSMRAWIAAVAMGATLAVRNRAYDRWNAAFLMTFTLVQLLESRIWTHLRSRDRNGAYTALVPAALWAQPTVQTYMAYLYTGRPWLLWAAGAYAVLAARALLHARASGGKGFASQPGPNGHLVWWDEGHAVIHRKWQGLIYLAGLFVPLLLIRHRAQRLTLLAFGLATFGWLWYRYSGTQEFSQMWCHVSVLYGALALVF